MINYDTKNWFRVILDFPKNQTFKILLPSLFVIGAYTAFVVYLEIDFFGSDFKITTTIHTLLGIVLGLLLVFRTNSSYDRWWEARKLYGSLVNNSRNLALKYNAILPEDRMDLRNYFSTMMSNYVLAMRDHLNKGVDLTKLKDIGTFKVGNMPPDIHFPNYIAAEIVKRTKQLNREGIISDFDFMILDDQIESYTDIIGACERIKKTPIPYAYAMHLKKFIAIYILTLPFGLMHELGYITVPAVMIVFYSFVGIELIGEEIEDPFGNDANDLPLDNISQTICNNIRHILTGWGDGKPDELPGAQGFVA